MRPELRFPKFLPSIRVTGVELLSSLPYTHSRNASVKRMHIKSGIKTVLNKFLPNIPLPSLPRIPHNRIPNPAIKYQAYAQAQSADPWSRADLGGGEYGGHGSFSGGGGGAGSCLSIDICPDLILAAIAVAAGVAVFIIYEAIVAAGKRRRSWSQSFFSLLLPQNMKLGDILNKGIKGDISVFFTIMELVAFFPLSFSKFSNQNHEWLIGSDHVPNHVRDAVPG